MPSASPCTRLEIWLLIHADIKNDPGGDVHEVLFFYNMKHNTIYYYSVVCHHNTVNFFKNIHNRYQTIHSIGRGMACLVWVPSLMSYTPECEVWSMFYGSRCITAYHILFLVSCTGIYIPRITHYIDGFVQKRRNPIAPAMGLRLSWIDPSILF